MCYVSKMVSKLSITSNLLCVLLVDLGMFFSFLNNGCPISCTILLGPPTLAGCMGQTYTGRLYGTDSHWQAVWDRFQPTGSDRQDLTDKIRLTWSDWQDPTNRIGPARNSLVHHQGEPKKDDHQHHLGTATRPSHSGTFCSFRGPQIFAKREKTRTQRLKMLGGGGKRKHSLTEKPKAKVLPKTNPNPHWRFTKDCFFTYQLVSV